MRIAKVIVNLSLDRHFDYLIPEDLVDKVRTGVQVNIPFGKSARLGYVLGLKDHSDYSPEKLKSIISVCEAHPEIPDNLMRLGKWISEYYCCSQEQAVKALLPLAVRSGKITHKHEKHYTVKSVEKAQEFIFEKGNRSKSKAEVLKYILQHPAASLESITLETGATNAIINQLVKNDLLEEEKRTKFRSAFSDEAEFVPSIPPQLNEEQINAMKVIDDVFDRKHGKQHAVLLYGVTGSGKTEVYMRAIETAFKKDLTAIVLVPEIALTPQTMERFISRFGKMVSILHSGLTDGERYDEWMKIYRGLVKIVVGARSALFAPFKNLGLIVVDEEHEHSYKQEETPRYNARDVAVMRGYMENAVVILGSATPSFESYRNALNGKYALARLQKRVDDRLMPVMRAVDMKVEMLSSASKGSIFSRELVEAVKFRIERAEQTMIFLNRRGFATQMSCVHCGFVAECSQCSVSYTYHKKRECLSCHICGSIIKAYYKCPDCGADDIRYKGIGTEKVENLITAIFPYAKIRRMDSDTMAGKRKRYEDVLRDFKSGKIDILVGTQMIAKGLDFPKVTLIGIVNADLSLHIPDFRASERTFQLLTQVAGRAGRGDIPGEVFVQTYTPQNPAIQYAMKYDYENFYQEEIDLREKFSYPPCGHLIAVHFKGADSAKVANFADEFLEKMRPVINENILVSGPVPAPLEKAKNKYRFLIVFRGVLSKDFRTHLRENMLKIKKPNDIDYYADVDAVNLS